MSNRTLITAIALTGLVLGACEKDAGTDDAIEPRQRELVDEPEVVDEPVVERREPMAERPMAERPMAERPMAEQPTEQREPGDYEIWPGVTILGIGVECAATNVHFATDSAELDAADKAALDNLAACLKGTPKQEQVEVTATTDPRGTERYNEELSRRRAEAVADYLKSQGVKEDSFQIRARGEAGVIEGIPTLWPMQREAVAEPKRPGAS